MALILFCSAHGAPGVTTAALACALTWPGDVLLADCDRDPSQAVLAGFLQGTDPGGRGLAGLAQAHRDGLDLTGEVARQTIPLTDEAAPVRRFLPGFVHPGSPALFGPVWSGLAEALHDLHRLDVDALVDAGRIGRDGLPTALVSRAARIVLVVRSHLPALAALHLALPDLRSRLTAVGGFGQLGLVIVGANRPYSEPEIAKQFELPVWASLPWAPKDAAILSDGTPVRPAKLTDRPLLRAARVLTSALAADVATEALRVDGSAAPGPGLASLPGRDGSEAVCHV